MKKMFGPATYISKLIDGCFGHKNENKNNKHLVALTDHPRTNTRLRKTRPSSDKHTQSLGMGHKENTSHDS